MKLVSGIVSPGLQIKCLLGLTNEKNKFQTANAIPNGRIKNRQKKVEQYIDNFVLKARITRVNK